MNSIQDNPITKENIKLAERTYGSDIANSKEKLTRTNEAYKNTNSIDIPHELEYKSRHLSLSIDTIIINGLIFLTSISHHLYFRTAQYINKKDKYNYKYCIKQIIQLYQNGNFQITNIHCDSEYK